MFLIDDLFDLLLDNINEYTMKGYIAELQDYLRRITLMYERGLIGREDYEKRRAEVVTKIEFYTRHLQQKRGPTGRLELRL